MEIGTLKSLERFLVNQPINFWYQRFIDIPILLRWGHLPRRASILEIGCGTGHLARYLSQRLNAKNYTAIDNDPQIVAHAEHLTKKNAHLIFQMADVTKLPFSNASFDAVIVMNALHTIIDWKKALREINRVLKKNGKLLIRDYSIESFTIPGLGLMLRTLFDHPYEYMYDQKEFLSYLRRIGFEVTHQSDRSWMMMLAASLTEK